MADGSTPRPGDIGVTPSSGFVARVIRWATRAPVAHAFIYVADGVIAEGDPHGARLTTAGRYPKRWWLIHLSAALTDGQRAGAVAWAVGQTKTHDGKGTPYSWLDDLGIGLIDVFGWAPRWLRRRMRSTATLMCSQLCVEAYRAAGVDLFPGVAGGAVSPGDLWRADAGTRRLVLT